MSVRRFPTLDSWGSSLEGAASAKPAPVPAGVQRTDSLAALAAQRFTHTFATLEPAAGEGAPPAPSRGLRKRHHSSRRTLMSALSRDNSAASSLDGMAPLGKASRHGHDESAGPSPDRYAAFAADALPRLPGVPPLHRSGSTLGREAAAAAAAMAAEAARALAAALPADAVPAAAATPLLRAFGADCGCGTGPACSAAGVPPSSPLHARMTCMRLRDTD